MGPVLLLSRSQGWLSHCWAILTSFTVLPRRGAGTTLRSAAAGEGQGQLCLSSALVTSGPSLPPATGGGGMTPGFYAFYAK